MTIAQEKHILPIATHLKRTRLVLHKMKMQGSKIIYTTQRSSGVSARNSMNHAKNIAPNLSRHSGHG